MKKLSEVLFSMQTMGMLILLFAFSIGAATFIENDFGATAAKAVVYNAMWFNVLLLLLTVNLVGRIIKDKMYKRKKIAVFLFHFSFIVILIGSGITRFVSYEGVMRIREGASNAAILSDNTYVEIYAAKGKGEEVVTERKKVHMSTLTPGAYSQRMEIEGKNFSFKSVEYIPNAQEVIIEGESGGFPYITFVYSDIHGRSNQGVKYGESIDLHDTKFNFSSSFIPGAINVKNENGSLFIHAEDTITTLSMMTSSTDTLEFGQWHPFESRKLYSIGEHRIVLTNFYKNGKLDYVPYSGQGSMMNAMIVEAKSGDETKEIVLRGGKGYEGTENYFFLNGISFKMIYGAREIRLPFAIKLKDFQLERYPGSNSPSSYASEVVVIDKVNNKRFDYRIFMNNVLNYGGYRFFQSSYDQDEMGTILSVNHDYWGTFFSYIGYALMTLGMVLSVFSKNTRFALLGRLIKKSAANRKVIKSLALVIAMTAATTSFAQVHSKQVSDMPEISTEQAEKFGNLIVQSHDGRFKPINTLSSEVLRKVSRKSKLDGWNSDQVMLGMLSSPVEWQQVQLIKIGHPEISNMLGIEGKKASYLDFIDMQQGTYKLGKVVTEAYERKPANRSKLDNELIKVDERLNICYMVYSGDILKILPDPTNIDKSWYSPLSRIVNVPQEDSLFLTSVIPTMLSAVSQGDKGLADQLIKGINDFQQRYAGSILPSKTKIDFEIKYNKMQIFNNLSRMYGLIVVILIILLFIELFRSSKALRYIINFFIILVVIGFLYQTYGLALRWYISGHAPWSDGYESMLYIAWVTLLAGLIFSHGSKMTIAATTFLSSVILMVAHLSWMDPEVTNLVPVLKSYWLTIHVSVITASYGFLALSTLLGLMNLILMIFKSPNNEIKLNNKIKELTSISERAIIVGLYLLVIGTFLGGVWANESWGRYWGWDPKETWALVSVLVYSFIAHMHYIPGMRGRFAFNFAALISYSVILMTYFGVNYYLSGLHSYAAGDPVPVPDFIYYSVAIVAIISILAFVREKRFAMEKVEDDEK